MQSLHKYLYETSGNMAMFAGLAFFAIMAGVAAGSDVVVWQSQQNKLQDAADAAALAGAVRLGKGGNKIEKTVHNEAHAFASDGNDTTMDGFQSDVVIDQDAETVAVNLSVEVPRIFSSMFMKTNPTVRAKSVAKVVHGKTACLYVLDPISSGAVSTSGSATMTATNCSIQVNSTSTSALTNAGNAIFNSDGICVAGGYTGYNYTPMPTPNCSPSPDPFESLVVPVAGICDHTNFTAAIDTVLNPGVYCGGIKISGTVGLTLNPGTYFIKDGDVKLSSGASLTGDGVVFVLEGLSSIDISGHGIVTTTPPTTGALEGFSVVQSRTEPLGPKSKISGEGQFDFPGIIYMPRGDLEITGKASTSAFTPSYSAVVVYQLKIAGSGEFAVTADTSNFSQNAAATLTSSSARLVQ